MSALMSARMTVRGTGLLMLVLGLVIWTGRADALIPVHMLIGFILVLALLALAYLAARAAAGTSLVVVAVALAILLPVLGLTQEGLVEGGGHWLVQVLHLALGLAAIGVGEALAGQAERGRTARTA